MYKKQLLKASGYISMGIMVLLMFSCDNLPKKKEVKETVPEQKDITPKDGAFTLPNLGFAFAALEPNIDAKTMAIHYSKHHQGYVDKLNIALDDYDFKDESLEEILVTITESEKDNGLRNNAGGHYNHSMFWEVLLPGGAKEPKGKLLSQIYLDFGSYESFKDEFAKSAGEVFGSGWAWLCVDKDGKLFITNTRNQDNPLMKKVVNKTGTPILALDVWEHAYYLNYQNERKQYITKFMEIVNWDVVANKLEKAIESKE